MKPIYRDTPADVESNDGYVHVQRTGLRISTTDRIRHMIRYELHKIAEDKEMETFEEADDFEFDEHDGEQWQSPYEIDFDPDFDAGAGRSPAETAVVPPADPSGESNEPPQPPPPTPSP